MHCQKEKTTTLIGNIKTLQCIGQLLIKIMNKYEILSTLKTIVKDFTIEFHHFNNYPVLNPIFEGEDGSLYKNNKGELIWNHYGEDFKVKDLDHDEFSLLFDLLLSNKAITFEEYSHLVGCLL